MYLIFRIIVLLGYFHIIAAGAGYYQLNVINKDTQQSSTQHNGVSSRAVDGNSNSDFGNGSCTHTNFNPPGAWWAVDLGQQYNVHSVGLVNRDHVEYRLDKFTIYGTDQTFNPDESNDKKTCYTFNGDFGKGEMKEFTCTALMNSRFVGIRLNHNEKLNLCEVYIYVACDNGRYGEDCGDTCSVNCLKTPCDRVTGACPDGGCKAGYTGDMCKQACENGKYGENCQEECSVNCKQQPCDRVTGACPEGECKAGYTGDICKNACDNGKYGENCQEDCSDNCKQQSCDRVTGACPEGECKAGYTGDMCKQECRMGTFGHQCKYNCSEHCKYQCDSTSDNGICIGGCMAGYKAETCDTECDPNEYGENCAFNCSKYCKEQICSSIDGSCANEESNTDLIQITCSTGIPVLTFAVAVAVPSFLCLGLIAYIIVGKVKTMRARNNGVSGNQDTTNVGHTYENDLIAATGQGDCVTLTQNSAPCERYERINNLDRNMNTNHEQTYQDLRV